MTIKEIVKSGEAVQVMFYDGEDMSPGIMVGDKIVCACCGAVFEVDEVVSNAIEDAEEQVSKYTDILTENQKKRSKLWDALADIHYNRVK